DALSAFEQVDRRLDLDVRRQQQDPDLRGLGADRAGRLEAFPALRRGHADVDDDKVRARFSHELRERVGIADGPDDLEPFTVEQARDPLAQEDVVLGDDDPGSGHESRAYACLAAMVRLAGDVDPPASETSIRTLTAETPDQRAAKPLPRAPPH